MKQLIIVEFIEARFMMVKYCMILSAMQGFENILEDKNKYLEH